MTEILLFYILYQINKFYFKEPKISFKLIGTIMVVLAYMTRIYGLYLLNDQGQKIEISINLYVLDFSQVQTPFLGQLFCLSASILINLLLIELSQFFKFFQKIYDQTENLMDQLRRYTAILPIIFLMTLLCLNILFFGDGALGGANQIVLVISAVFAGLLAWKEGQVFEDLLDGMKKNLNDSLEALMILLLIGALSGAWMLSGIVPTLIYYGLSFMSPHFFLPTTCLLCCVVSLASGSSWSTVATIGIALMGIGKSLGFSDGLIAGAIISGAYFGDKLSPLSDTTNLAPLMAGTDLFTHIRYMLWTTIPTLILSLILFSCFSFWHNPSEINDLQAIQQLLSEKIFIHPLLLITPLIVFVLILFKVPTLPLLFLGTILGVITAFFTQDTLMQNISQHLFANAKSSFQAHFQVCIQAMSGELRLLDGLTVKPDQKGIEQALSKLLFSKGMAGMLSTVWLIMCAMCFGGVMEKAGYLNRISQYLLSFVKSDASLVTCTAGSCIFFNISASDQYLSIVVPGRMFKQSYADRGLAPEVLSRTLEDCGTVTSVLIPWNTCGAAQSSVLGISTLSYLPYCFFNLLSPIMTLLMIYLNLKISRIMPQKNLIENT
jgi:NhaC family Na+:H+ antiporter